MAKHYFLKLIAIFFLLPAGNLLAKDRTALETFIAHVKEANTFVEVGNLWQRDQAYNPAEMQQYVSKAQPLSIDYTQVAAFMNRKSTAINLVIPGTDGASYTLELARYEFFSGDFQVHERSATGDKLFAYAPGLYYSGVVKGIEGSFAVFSFFNNEVYGVFSIPGEGNYALVPNTLEGKSYNFNTHYILYRESDLKIRPAGEVCGTDNLPEIKLPVKKTTTVFNNNVYNHCMQVRCMEVADYAMYQNKGNSTTNVANYLTSLFNVKAALYKNEGIIINMKYLQVNTTVDPYNALATDNSSRWLRKFGGVTQNALNGCDVATLYTTKGGGSMGGVAWLGLTCEGWFASDSAGPYCFCNLDGGGINTFPTYTWNANMAAHELGHSLGSPHTHRCCWNPPARNTAIDGCYTIEGSCPNPGIPSSTVKGTVMSYCHLTSAGVSFTNGFGPQPGDTIRRFIADRIGSCFAPYNPQRVLQTANRTITANRECTDMSTGVATTYYWKDNNTANQNDDTVVLIVMKNGNNIGTLNNAGFSVSTGTIASYGGGSGQSITFPAGVSGLQPSNISIRRFWKMTPTTQPTSAVDVFFPFRQTDVNDINGTVPGSTVSLNDFKLYRVNAPVDPAPGGGFGGSTAASFTIYSYDATASTSRWSYTSNDSGYFARFKTTNLSGGSLFYSYNMWANSVGTVGGNTVTVYPNPASDVWHLNVGGSTTGVLSLQLLASDGRLVHTQFLHAGDNTIDAKMLGPGIYFYRINSNGEVFRGTVTKE